uniref:Uncharacterized protein n=1 Tax=Triticum urartu TaxID=4572 RepID=A0A8R7U012_TRIUA
MEYDWWQHLRRRVRTRQHSGPEAA